MSILAKLPVEANWLKMGKITNIKHQKSCQGCYVFSALAALESQIIINYDIKLTLSEQEIIDCSDKFKNHGCKGGQPEYVYNYIVENGINLE